jgi:hypothetical protein
MSVTPNSSKVGEIPEGLLRAHSIRVGLYKKLKLNGTEAVDCCAVELRRMRLRRSSQNDPSTHSAE